MGCQAINTNHMVTSESMAMLTEQLDAMMSALQDLDQRVESIADVVT